jgi:hypothetical protein
MDLATPHSLRFGSRLVLLRISKEAEPFLCVGVRMTIQRSMVDARRWAWDLSVIGRRVEVDDMEPILEEVDTGYK